MMRLPEKIRKALEKITREMMAVNDVYGIGLFGSWSRGDAEASSDVDLFILVNGNFENEYVERIELNGLLVDLDFIPKRWIHGPIPPELDQKLCEMQILYDKDWSLTNTKLLITKSYSLPERVAIRTEAHLIESDIYLSRATSAFSREDFKSAQLFATMAVEKVLRVLVEISLAPFSNSRFIEKVEGSASKLGMHSLFDEYLEMTKINKFNNANVEEKTKFFKKVWDELNTVIKQNQQTLETSHFKVKTKLKYYLNTAFLQGAIMRTNSLISSGKTAEASHYLNAILIDLIENYAWLKASIDNVKIDYTTLIRSLENLEKKTPKNYEHIIKLLNLSEIDKSDAAKTIEKARKAMLKIRGERKVLIKNHLLKT